MLDYSVVTPIPERLGCFSVLGSATLKEREDGILLQVSLEDGKRGKRLLEMYLVKKDGGFLLFRATVGGISAPGGTEVFPPTREGVRELLRSAAAALRDWVIAPDPLDAPKPRYELRG